MVERKLSWPAAQQHQKHSRPLDVRRPSLRINKDLNHRGHTEQNQRRRPRKQAKDKQHRRGQLDDQRHVGRKLRREEWDLIFVGEELNGRVPICEFCLRGVPEHGGNPDAERQRQKCIGNLFEKADRAVDPCGWGRRVIEAVASVIACAPMSQWIGPLFQLGPGESQ